MYEKLVTRIPLFTSLPQSEIKSLVATLRKLDFPPRTILFREGDHGDRFYIILEGQLEIIKSLGTPDEKLLNVCGSGDHVGEMCLLDPDRSRTASIRARSPVKLLEITRADLDALLHQYPTVGYTMARILSQRLRNSENRMVDELNRKNRQLSQALSRLQSRLPDSADKQRGKKQKSEVHFNPILDFDHQIITLPKDRKKQKSSKKTWEVRRLIYRSALSPIHVKTFGDFRLYRGLTYMEEKEWEGHLPKLLLKAIIVCGSSGVPKDQIIETLWPEITPESGERNFKITLHRLRKAMEPTMDKTFGSSYVHLKANSIYLDGELCKIDLDDFLSFYDRGEKKEREGNIEEALILYRSAIDLYNGDFLSEERYVPWVDIKREELQKSYIDLLYKVADIQDKRGTSKVAINCYKKIIQIDPLSEQAYQRLMTIYSNRRMRTEALKVYEDCRKTLREGLDTEPETLTTSIYRRIMDVR
ncbi:MAG: BTAD domain-containing putative transcriptional regulator [Syntrophaceae bacterium]